MSRPSVSLAAIAAAVALAACDRETAGTAASDAAPADAVGTGRAASGSLRDRIIVDPARTGSRHGARAAAHDPTGKCDYVHDAAWARRLPAALPPYPGARLIEAAGSDAPGCERRIASFAAPDAPAQVIAFYSDKVAAAGYSAEHLVQQGADVLGGTRGDAAYLVTVSPSETGSNIDLVANAN